MAYDKNDVTKLTCKFRDTDDALVDPTGVRLKIKTPSGSTTTYTYGTDSTPTKASTGIYNANVTLNETGTWYVRFEGTGTNAGAVEKYLTVRTTQF